VEALESVLQGRTITYLDNEVCKLAKGLKTSDGGGEGGAEEEAAEDFC
jgi:hypothetical protein